MTTKTLNCMNCGVLIRDDSKNRLCLDCFLTSKNKSEAQRLAVSNARKKCCTSSYMKWVSHQRENVIFGRGRNDYGCGWETIRLQVLERDNYQCRICGKDLHGKYCAQVHHRILFRLKKSNDLYWLISTCPKCHGKVERNLFIILEDNEVER